MITGKVAIRHEFFGPERDPRNPGGYRLLVDSEKHGPLVNVVLPRATGSGWRPGSTAYLLTEDEYTRLVEE